MAVKHGFGVVVTTLTLALAPAVLACEGCYAPANHVEHVRHVKRMQPDALNATYAPTRALEWGQLNFLHTVCRFPRIDTLPGANQWRWANCTFEFVDRHPWLAGGTPEGEELRC